MATVNKQIAEMVIRGNGYYPGDEHLPVVERIVQYTDSWGGRDNYGLIYRGEPLNRYHNSPGCHNVVVVWDRLDLEGP